MRHKTLLSNTFQMIWHTNLPAERLALDFRCRLASRICRMIPSEIILFLEVLPLGIENNFPKFFFNNVRGWI